MPTNNIMKKQIPIIERAIALFFISLANIIINNAEDVTLNSTLGPNTKESTTPTNVIKISPQSIIFSNFVISIDFEG